MFDLGLVDYEFAMDMNGGGGGGGGIDYAGYDEYSHIYGVYDDISTAASEMGMGMGVPADAMWNIAGQSQAQQA